MAQARDRYEDVGEAPTTAPLTHDGQDEHRSLGQSQAAGRSITASVTASSAEVPVEADLLAAAAVDGAAGSYGDGTTLHRDWTPTQMTAAIDRVKLLEFQLFDEEESVPRGMAEGRAEQLLGEINALRHKLGWLRLDLHRNPVWPD